MRDLYSYSELNRVAHTKKGYKKILKFHVEKEYYPEDEWEDRYRKACYYAKALDLTKYIGATHHNIASFLVTDEEFILKTMEKVKGNTPISAMNIIVKEFCEIFKIDISNKYWKSLLCRESGHIIKSWYHLVKETHDIGQQLSLQVSLDFWYTKPRFWYDISQWVLYNVYPPETVWL